MAFLKLAFKKRTRKEEETPGLLFNKLKGENSFLLESQEGGRFSYIGYDPFMVCWLESGSVYLLNKRNFFDFKKSGVKQILEGDPMKTLRKIFSRFEMKGDCPVPFYGGAAGYFSYDFGCRFLGVEQKVFDDVNLPGFYFVFVDKVVAFDHQENLIYLVALAETETSAKRKTEEMESDLNRPEQLKRMGEIGRMSAEMSRKQYLEKIGNVKKLLEKGETYQVNFSQRFNVGCTADPWLIYEKLAERNPAPFGCFFEMPEFSIISSSPELLIRKRKSQVETWPIKGTVKRGKNKNEDETAQVNLLSSKKEEAELNMIVDLARNDLGRVCEPGTVKVLGHREIQKLPNIFHTFSRIGGKLQMKKDVFDLIEAVFPGGSITGCPKKRTMEIIDKLEDFKRGVYTGSAGFINFSGDCDFNILIRTMLLKDKKLYLQAGGGIVIDSDPEREYEETLLKAKGLVETLSRLSA
jgi:para-aminobenzoate synthetase component 1